VRTPGLALAVAACVALLPLELAAQGETTPGRGRVSRAIAPEIDAIARDAGARGLPVEPLVQKAIEGEAKGVSSDRIIVAVRALAGRLDQARAALAGAGISKPTPEAIESGADALNAGLSANEVRGLGRISRSPYDPEITLRVAATLSALGVPGEQGVRLLEQRIQAGRGPDALMQLPGEVQMDIARGASPGEAAHALERDDPRGGPQGDDGLRGDQGHQGEGSSAARD
jgi:hypothetical protein